MNQIRQAVIFVTFILVGLLPVLLYLAIFGELGSSKILETQSLSREQQFVLMLSLFIIKPAYLLICVGLIILLHEQTALPLRSLFWGLIFFLQGEMLCGATYIAFRQELIISEYIHGYGVALQFGLVTFALIEIADAYWPGKQSRIGSASVIAIAVIASFLPLSVSNIPGGYLTNLFGYPYAFARFEFNQWAETRALPLLALTFFIIAFLPILKSKSDPIPQLTKIFFSAGMGALGFSLFRIILASTFANNLVWFEFWEELTELMFTSAIGFMLWQFRSTLLHQTPILEALSFKQL